MGMTNMQRLGNTLSDRMKKTSKGAVPTTVELGVINGDLSLTVDSIGAKISPSEYMIDLRLTHETYCSYSSSHTHAASDHTHSGGSHDHRAPSVFRRLEPGDRVLVMWVGHEPVILSIVVAGTTITPN